MKMIPMAVAALFAAASGARAGDGGGEPSGRCRFSTDVKASVLVRYPIEHQPPEGVEKHESKHTDNSLQGHSATYVQALGEEHPAAIGIGDFNGDGTCDLLWQNATAPEPATRLAVTFGFTQVHDVDFAAQATDTLARPWEVAGVFDLTGDGMADVLWWNARTGQLQVWRRLEEALPSWAAAPVHHVSELPDLLHPLVITRLLPEGPVGVLLGPSSGAGQPIYHHAYWTGAALQLVNVGPTVGLPSPGWRPVAVGHFDDGSTEDLLLQNLETRRLKVCFMAGLVASECTDLDPDSFDVPNQLPSHIVGPR